MNMPIVQIVAALYVYFFYYYFNKRSHNSEGNAMHYECHEFYECYDSFKIIYTDANSKNSIEIRTIMIKQFSTFSGLMLYPQP